MPKENIEQSIRQAKQRFGIVGNDQALHLALERAIKVAPHELSVLIIGESGTGKEFFPKVIHENSRRRHSRYFAVNCGAIPEGTIDSELFGHEKGAFTGAISDRKGYFEEADGGTLFLDEVAELPMSTQARLLRVLESGEFIRVGSSDVRKTNVRIVAATNVNMTKAIEEGRFREDLFYRLSTVTIVIPPLRERADDIVMIARKFAADFAEKNQTDEISFDTDARWALMKYRWPGNVRQLKNVIDQIAIFESGKTITKEIISAYLPADTRSTLPATVKNSPSYESEREFLFKMVLSLRQEVEELRAKLSGDDTAAVNEHKALSNPSARQVNEEEIGDLDVVD